MKLTLPHYFQIGLGLVAVILTWVMQQNSSGALVLPAAVVSALVVLKTVIGVFSTSANPDANVAAVSRAAATKVIS
jgi:hypothetical protein